MIGDRIIKALCGLFAKLGNDHAYRAYRSFSLPLPRVEIERVNGSMVVFRWNSADRPPSADDINDALARHTRKMMSPTWMADAGDGAS